MDDLWMIIFWVEYSWNMYGISMVISGWNIYDIMIWLVVEVSTPLKNIWVRQLGWWNSQVNGNIQNVPNHQPVFLGSENHWSFCGWDVLRFFALIIVDGILWIIHYIYMIKLYRINGIWLMIYIYIWNSILWIIRHHRFYR